MILLIEPHERLASVEGSRKEIFRQFVANSCTADNHEKNLQLHFAYSRRFFVASV